jgi:hypothetical protein
MEEKIPINFLMTRYLLRRKTFGSRGCHTVVGISHASGSVTSNLSEADPHRQVQGGDKA